MTYTIESEIDRFKNFAKGAHAHLLVERVCDFGFIVRSREGGMSGPRPIALTLMGLTHGNEVAGVAVLNELLASLNSGSTNLKVPVAFILGNPWAARENKRFLERDLNRAFARANPQAKEELRARDLEAVLNQTDYIVDYHQTMRGSDRPFFIFPYHAKSYAFARQLAPKLSIVTHWGKPFSAEGMCTDEFVIREGGTGVSIELGQNGFEPYQIAVGVELGRWAIQLATEAWSRQPPDAMRSLRQAGPADLYTWAEIMAWPARGIVELDEGWTNFREVARNQRLGLVGGVPLLAPKAGRMLFPKYLTREQQAALESRPTELCRLVKPITEADLPQT